MIEQFSNNAISTIQMVGGFSAIATSLTVASSALFPSQGQFRIRIDNELMIVTGVSGNVFTCIRGQEGTSAFAHANGAKVTHVFTAGAIAELAADIAASISGGAVGIPSKPGTDGFYLLDVSSGTASWVIATQDLILPGFAPSLSMASGGNGPLECGQVWTPSLNGTPAPNGAGVTAYTVSDNQGGGPTTVTGPNPFSAPSATYSLPTPGTVSVTATVTKGGITRTTNAESCPFDLRFFSGCDSHAGATGATASAPGGNTATLSGGSASVVMAGSLSANMIGTTFAVAPSGSQWVYALYPHTSIAGTFQDSVSGFAFNMSVVATFSFTNQYGAIVSYDLYRSDFIQTIARTVKRIS